jgi:hypothetical protein
MGTITLAPDTFYTATFELNYLTEGVMDSIQDLSQARSASMAEMEAHLRRGAVEIVGPMLDSGLSPDFKGLTGDPSLCVCANKEALLYLLDRGADPNVTDDGGWNPLQTGTRGADMEFIEPLHARGANIPPAG